MIVTANVNDFPTVLWGHSHRSTHSDVFVGGLIDLDAEAVVTVLHQHQKDLIRRPLSVPQLLDVLEGQRLVPDHRRPSQPLVR